MKKKKEDAIHLFHKIRKEAEQQNNTYKGIFISLIWLLVLDCILVLYIYKSSNSIYELTVIARVGFFVLISLSALTLKMAYDSNNYIDNLDEFYLELDMKK